jgi:hypothetical protein
MGMINISRLPTPHSVLPPSSKLSFLLGVAPSAQSRTAGGGGGLQNNLCYKIKRKGMVFETFNLDAEPGDPGEGGGGKKEEVRKKLKVKPDLEEDEGGDIGKGRAIRFSGVVEVGIEGESDTKKFPPSVGKKGILKSRDLDF